MVYDHQVCGSRVFSTFPLSAAIRIVVCMSFYNSLMVYDHQVCGSRVFSTFPLSAAIRIVVCMSFYNSLMVYDHQVCSSRVFSTFPLSAAIRIVVCMSFYNSLIKLEAQGHDVPALLARARATDLSAFLSGEEGDEVWSLLLLMARSDDVAEQAIRSEDVALVAKHAFAVAQAFHSYYQKPRYSLLHADSEDLRACRTLVVDAFVRQMEQLLHLLGIPVPERM